jgi:glutamate synthase (NADPH/NADH) large chain
MDDGPETCRRIKVLNPIMPARELNRLLNLKPELFKSATLDTTFTLSNKEEGKRKKGLKVALEALVANAIEAVKFGSSLIVLSDRAVLKAGATSVPIPSLLALGAVHQGLVKAGLRMRASLIVDSAEPREIMHFALLFGYGADLIVPYGALESIGLIGRDGSGDSKRIKTYVEAEQHYIKALNKAMLKLISKMGTSTLRSYRGAQIFEALGLGPEVIDLCFTGTASRIGGAGFEELEEEALARYREAEKAREDAGAELLPENFLLSGEGQYKWRRNGESHAWNPETIYLLQWATRTGDYTKFKQFSAVSDELNKKPHVLRGLIDFNPAALKEAGLKTLDISEVESVESIMTRFTTGAMSLGSLSREAHETDRKSVG